MQCQHKSVQLELKTRVMSRRINDQPGWEIIDKGEVSRQSHEMPITTERQEAKVLSSWNLENNLETDSRTLCRVKVQGEPSNNHTHTISGQDSFSWLRVHVNTAVEVSSDKHFAVLSDTFISKQTWYRRKSGSSHLLPTLTACWCCIRHTRGQRGKVITQIIGRERPDWASLTNCKSVILGAIEHGQVWELNLVLSDSVGRQLLHVAAQILRSTLKETEQDWLL